MKKSPSEHVLVLPWKLFHELYIINLQIKNICADVSCYYCSDVIYLN